MLSGEFSHLAVIQYFGLRDVMFMELMILGYKDCDDVTDSQRLAQPSVVIAMLDYDSYVLR